MGKALDQARTIMSTVKDLNAASAVLGWDQETYMPDGSGEARAEQIATLDTLAHTQMTNDRAVRLLDELRHEQQTDDTEQRLASVFIEDVERACKLPENLVRETSKACALAQESWKKARANNAFELFSGDLHHLVQLKAEAAELLGYTENRYDALLNLFEPGMSVSQLTPVFDKLREGTKTILHAIEPKKNEVSNDVLFRGYDKEKQLAFAQSISKSIGFDYEYGRVDLSAHPFCTSFAQTDVRLTTRVFENDVRSCLFGLIHESGHGMYEQGIAKTLSRTFASDGASMGIHESQSLFWENVIARSEEFWGWALPTMKDFFPEQLAGVSPFDFYKAINRIEPSLIRIEADELTYNLHIILRFEIEEALINGRISVDDVPTVWNTKMKDSLGLTPPNDAQGCLQDIHWSFGGFGYFPSYTLGKLYAAMMRKALLRDVPEVSDLIRRGQFTPILQWLRDHVHTFGRTRKPNELIKAISGQALSEQDFLEYINAKAVRVYGL